MSPKTPFLRFLIRLLLKLFPEDTPGVTRAEMEETFYDRSRAEGGPGVLFLVREIVSLVRHGTLERLRSLSPPQPLAGLLDDLRFAVRALNRNKLFALGAVVMLALGIGLNTATFSMHTGMSRVVQRFQDPDELVFLWAVEEGWNRGSVSAGDFFAWREETTAFREMGVYVQSSGYVTGGGEPVRIGQVRIMSNLFTMLGLDAGAGRLFGSADDAPSAPSVAVLSWRFWQERYGGSEEALGQSLLLNGTPHTIVGVLSRTAEFESLWRGTSVFTPIALNPAVEDWDARIYRVMARLEEDASVEQAQTQVSAVATRISEARPETHGRLRARIESFEDRFYSAEDRLAIVGMVLAVLAVLLIACVNLANLLLAKGATRQGEMAIRLAMGASRGRMVRQLLSESLILSLLGGTIGIFLGQWALDLLLSALPSAPFLHEDVGLDPGLLTFALFVSVSAALTFGLTPAVLASRVSLGEGVKESRAGASTGHKRKRLRTWILVTQLSLTVPLVLTCGVSFLNLRALQNTDFGFSTEGLLTAEVSLPPHVYAESEQQARFFTEALESLGGLPGVAEAAAGMAVPIGPGQRSAFGPMVVDGRESAEGAERGPTGYQAITPGYFRTLGVPVRRGRAFTADDGPNTPHVAVVNEAFADRYWPGEDAVGKMVRPETDSRRLYPGMEGGITQAVTVVGVVANHGASFYGEPLGGRVYLPQGQHPTSSLLLVVRSNGDAGRLVPSIRDAVARVDPGVPITAIRTGEGMMDVWLQESRAIGAALGLLAVLALGMAVLGLYGMVAHSVAQRTFELGVRMVLGANRWAIRASVMRSFVLFSGLGMTVGLVIAVVAGLVARSFLVLLQVSYLPMVLGTTALLMGVATIAALVPAIRATNIEPVVALRCE
jgi:putative ABC transport system permease protein